MTDGHRVTGQHLVVSYAPEPLVLHTHTDTIGMCYEKLIWGRFDIWICFFFLVEMGSIFNGKDFFLRGSVGKRLILNSFFPFFGHVEDMQKIDARS